MVTGTMAHPGDNILYLDITGLDEPLGVTDTHPIWSETRQDFVLAGQLKVGEQFRTLNGESATLTKIHPHRGPPQMVFNLEVDAEHVYLVAGNGLLVHNACPPLPLHGRPHGGPAHNSVIDQVLGEVVAEGAEDVRKNQALVDIFGDKLTDLRPDGQWTQDGVRHIMQIVDSNPNTHQNLFQQLIPDAVFHIYQIGNNIPVP